MVITVGRLRQHHCRHVNGADDIALSIRKDAHSVSQWFPFFASPVLTCPDAIRITDLAGGAYPGGWPNFIVP
jgi:hypothetical protein